MSFLNVYEKTEHERQFWSVSWPGAVARNQAETDPTIFYYCSFRFINPLTVPGSFSEINCRISSSAAILSTLQQIVWLKKKNNVRAILGLIKHALAEPLSLTHTHALLCSLQKACPTWHHPSPQQNHIV